MLEEISVLFVVDFRQQLGIICKFEDRISDLRLEKFQVKYDLRKFGFTNRVVNTWNSLPNWVVSASIYY